MKTIITNYKRTGKQIEGKGYTYTFSVMNKGGVVAMSLKIERQYPLAGYFNNPEGNPYYIYCFRSDTCIWERVGMWGNPSFAFILPDNWDNLSEKTQRRKLRAMLCLPGKGDNAQ